MNVNWPNANRPDFPRCFRIVRLCLLPLLITPASMPQQASPAAESPLTIECSASPAAAYRGGTSTITSIASSPQNRPLTYSYSTTGGTINGNASTATLSLVGATAGATQITCTVSDDQGHTASATTSVMVSAPTPPPPSPPPAPAPPPPTEHGNLPGPPRPGHAGIAPTLHGFPWPPPKPSAQVPLNLPLHTTGYRTQGEVDQKLTAALAPLGYVERAYFEFSDNSGFALVTRIEQIAANGTSKRPPDRFSATLPPPRNFTDYFRALLTTQPGYFRVIVFVVTNAQVQPTNQAPRQGDADVWLGGAPSLTSVDAKRTLPSNAAVTALIYEFENSGTGAGGASLIVPGTVTGKQHLSMAGIWQKLNLQ